MGFPAQTVDGEAVEIVEKGQQGDVELFRAANGDVYVRSEGTNLLIPHPGNASMQTPIEVFEELINESADRERAKDEADQIGEQIADEVFSKEGFGEGDMAIVTALDELREEGEGDAEEGDEAPEAA